VNNVVTLSPTLNNGGFEDGATGYILGSNASIDTTVSKSGSNSAKLNVVGGAYTYLSKQNAPIEVGQQVKVSFWVKSSVADGSNRFRLVLGSTNNQFTPSSTDWELYEVTQTVYSTTEMTFARVGAGDFTIHIDDITVTNLTSDGHVTTWYDQSGNNNSSNQPLASSQPKIVDGGTLVTEGGQAALDFDGVDDSLKYSGDLFGTNTAAMFIVNSFDVATATKRDVIAGGQDTSGTRYDFVIVRQSSSGMQPYIEGSGFSGGISTTDTNQHLYSVTHNSGTSTGSFNRDGVTTATPSSSASVTSATDFVIGTDISSPSDSLNGQIQEIVVFNTNQSANRTGIENNINDHFDIYS
jgi:hypothetical protein